MVYVNILSRSEDVYRRNGHWNSHRGGDGRRDRRSGYRRSDKSADGSGGSRSGQSACNIDTAELAGRGAISRIKKDPIQIVMIALDWC